MSNGVWKVVSAFIIVGTVAVVAIGFLAVFLALMFASIATLVSPGVT